MVRLLPLILLGCLLIIHAHLPAYGQQTTNKVATRVEGVVRMLTADLIVVKSPDGTSTLFSVTKETSLDPTIKAGDQVEVLMSSDHQATAIRKLSVK